MDPDNMEPSKCGKEAVRYLRALGRPKEPIDILDIGCGNGRDLHHLSRHFHINALGIDIDREAIRHAKRANTGSRPGCVTFRCCAVSQQGDRKYDVILCSGMYHFLRPNEREEMTEFIGRALKPKGAHTFSERH